MLSLLSILWKLFFTSMLQWFITSTWSHTLCQFTHHKKVFVSHDTLVHICTKFWGVTLFQVLSQTSNISFEGLKGISIPKKKLHLGCINPPINYLNAYIYIYIYFAVECMYKCKSLCPSILSTSIFPKQLKNSALYFIKLEQNTQCDFTLSNY